MHRLYNVHTGIGSRMTVIGSFIKSFVFFLFLLATPVHNQQCLIQKRILSEVGVCPNRTETAYPCADLCTGIFITSEHRCIKSDHCCFRYNSCVIKQIVNVPPNISVNQQISGAFQDQINSQERNLMFGGTPISLIKQLFPTIPICLEFPHNCSAVYTSPDDLQPPINVPYCQRIACQPGNPFLEFNPEKCISTPGCGFDFALGFYRSILGQAYLPGVPLCHLAIRNHVFLKRASSYLQKSGSKWNPLFTECLIKEYETEIFSESKGCAKVKVIQELGYKAKLAGWNGISSRDCYLINGCWLENKCVYPLSSGSIRTKSINNPEFDINVFGKPRCALLDKNSNNSEFLDAYHSCLQAGCNSNVDESVIIGKLFEFAHASVPLRLQPRFITSVSNGEVRPDNYKDFLHHLASENHSLLNPVFKKNHSEMDGSNSFLSSNGSPIRPNVRSFIFNPFKAPIQPGPNMLCPFRNLNWPSFPALSGSFEGCCEAPLCYTPRIAIRSARSVIASYLTSWKSWGRCSTSCGSGIRRRRRFCVGHDCGIPEVETETCEQSACPINLYSTWSRYGSCTVTCGGGVMVRTRTCSIPNQCSELLKETKRCRTGRCPTIRYNQWSRCTTTCGFGTQRRQGRCENPGTYGCPKNHFQEMKCQRFCGHIRYEKSSCNIKTCIIKETARCVLGDGRPGYCRKSKTLKSAKARKCYHGHCLCFHRPGLPQCRNKIK